MVMTHALIPTFSPRKKENRSPASWNVVRRKWQERRRANLRRTMADSLSVGRWPGCTAIELRRNGFFLILIVILLLISKILSRARLRLRLRLRACQCGPAAGLNSMAVGPG